jgi:hypothetical protein
LVAGRSTLADATVKPSTILANPSQYDGQHVAVSGTVTNIQEKTSHRGNAYDIFELCDTQCIRVFTFGHPSITERQHLVVHGTFSETKHVGSYTFHNEIEADENSL